MKATVCKGPFFFLSVAMLLSTAAAAQAQNQNPLPDCYVLAIGVDVYVREAQLPNLSGCVRDATNLTQRMRDQEGQVFGKVQSTLLTNENATQPNFEKSLLQLKNPGKPGDWVVFIMSSHGGINLQNRWEGVLNDGKTVTDHKLLNWTRDLAGQRRKVWIIVDTCHAGQMRLNAQELLERFADRVGGGIILTLASMPSENSQALGKYSTYAEAVNEALLGDADYNRDGNITLKELRHYAYRRAYELNRQYERPVQDGECSYSMSISEELPLARSRMQTLFTANADLTKQDARDKVRQNSYAKTYEVKLQAGVAYIIDLKSSVFDAYLRLEDAQGTQVAFNDDVGGADRDSRIVYTPTISGAFRVIATSYVDNGTGAFTLKVRQKLDPSRTPPSSK